MSQFAPGDRVYVTDPALAQMRAIMQQATGTKPPPNHHGTVIAFWDDATVLIAFDENGIEAAGNAAPYSQDEVRHLP